MILLLGGLFVIAAIAGLIVSIIFSKKKFRIYLAAFNCVLLLIWAITAIVYKVDIEAEEEESYEYVITKSDGLDALYYEGTVDGYEYVTVGGVFAINGYVVPSEMVEVSGFCKIYKPAKLYSRRNESFVTGGSESLIHLSNGNEAYLSENIVLIKPDYKDLLLYTGIFAVLILCIHDITCGIIVLVKKKRR